MKGFSNTSVMVSDALKLLRNYGNYNSSTPYDPAGHNTSKEFIEFFDRGLTTLNEQLNAGGESEEYYDYNMDQGSLKTKLYRWISGSNPPSPKRLDQRLYLSLMETLHSQKAPSDQAVISLLDHLELLQFDCAEYRPLVRNPLSCEDGSADRHNAALFHNIVNTFAACAFQPPLSVYQRITSSVEMQVVIPKSDADPIADPAVETDNFLTLDTLEKLFSGKSVANVSGIRLIRSRNQADKYLLELFFPDMILGTIKDYADKHSELQTYRTTFDGQCPMEIRDELVTLLSGDGGFLLRELIHKCAAVTGGSPRNAELLLDNIFSARPELSDLHDCCMWCGANGHPERAFAALLLYALLGEEDFFWLYPHSDGYKQFLSPIRL